MHSYATNALYIDKYYRDARRIVLALTRYKSATYRYFSDTIMNTLPQCNIALGAKNIAYLLALHLCIPCVLLLFNVFCWYSCNYYYYAYAITLLIFFIFYTFEPVPLCARTEPSYLRATHAPHAHSDVCHMNQRQSDAYAAMLSTSAYAEYVHSSFAGVFTSKILEHQHSTAEEIQG